MSLGTLTTGQRAELPITLRNRTSRPLGIRRVETSCPCLRAEPMSFTVRPGESAEVRLAFDSSQEPDFRGGLSIGVVGYDSAGEAVFRTRVDLDVWAGPSARVVHEPTEHTAMGREGLNRRD